MGLGGRRCRDGSEKSQSSTAAVMTKVGFQAPGPFGPASTTGMPVTKKWESRGVTLEFCETLSVTFSLQLDRSTREVELGLEYGSPTMNLAGQSLKFENGHWVSGKVQSACSDLK